MRISRVEEIKNRLAAATPGKWRFYKGDPRCFSPEILAGSGEQTIYVVSGSEWIHIKDADGEFIAKAKEDIEYLLDLICGSID